MLGTFLEAIHEALGEYVQEVLLIGSKLIESKGMEKGKGVDDHEEHDQPFETRRRWHDKISLTK